MHHHGPCPIHPLGSANFKKGMGKKEVHKVIVTAAALTFRERVPKDSLF